MLTLEETEWFLEAAAQYRYFNEFRLALETGMRIGEIIGLKWSDIDYANQSKRHNRSNEVYHRMDNKNETRL